MSRLGLFCHRRVGLLALATTALLFAGTHTAQASLSYFIDQIGTGSTALSVTSQGQSFNMELYGMIQDSGGGTAANDSMQETSIGIAESGSLVTAMGGQFTGSGPKATTFTYLGSLQGEGSALGWGSASSGTIGIGGSVTGSPSTSNNNTLFWQLTATQTGTPVTVNGQNYTEVPIGSFTLTFTGALPSSTSTSSLTIMKQNASSGNSNIWYEAGSAKSAQGSSSNILGLVTPVTFTYTNNISGSTVDSVQTLAAATVGASPINATGSTTIGSVLGVTSTAVSPNSPDSISSSASATSLYGATLGGSPFNAGTIAAGGTAAVSFTYTPKSTFFGTDTVTVNGSGKNITSSDPASSGPVTASVSVIGVGPVASVPALSASNYGATLTSSTGGIAGLTTMSSGDNTILSTTATILAGASTTTGLTEAWRARTSAEAAHTVGLNNAPLVSDAVNLNGTGTGTGNAYVLQMSFDPSQFGNATTEAAAIANGQVYVAVQSPANAALGLWGGNAANLGDQGSAKQTGVNGPFSSISASSSLANLLGSWGVNTLNNTAWAVIDYSGGDQFAVVPEPGTLALLAAGVAALGLAYRRRKIAKA